MAKSKSPRQKAFEFASNELAWHGAHQFALKLLQPVIERITKHSLQYPKNYAAFGNFLEVLHQNARFEPASPPGAYRNKAAIVYVISIIESFLREVCTDILQLSGAPSRFGELLEWSDLKCALPGYGQTDELKQVHLVRLIRNAIVHNHGIVPKTFWRDPKPYKNASTYIGAWAEDHKEFKKWYKPERPVWVHIDKVVLPSVFCAKRFVHHVNDRLTAQNYD